MATRNEIKVELTGVHLCCQGCVNAADTALTSVEGVHSRCEMEDGTITRTAEPRVTTFAVTGDFYAADLIRAINRAGFSAQVKQ